MKILRATFMTWLVITFCIGGMDTYGQTAESGGIIDPFELGASARILGMGGAGVALTGDGAGFLQNPALLSTLTEGELLSLHSPLFIDTLYDSLGYVQPLSGSSGIALSLSRLGVDNVFQTQTNIQPISTFSTQQWQATAALGGNILPGLGVGLLAKGVREDIANYSGEGVGLDAGLVYRLASSSEDYAKLGLSNLTVGVAVANLISPQVTLYQTADKPAEIYKAGLGFRYDISPAGDRFWLVLESDMPQGAGNVIEAGAEYAFQNTFFARVGYDGVSPTAGAGVSYGGFELDYAYNQRDLGTLNRFSVSYRFGEYLDPVIAQKKELENQKLEMLKWVAKSYEKDEDYDAAIKAWGNVLKEYPRDIETPKAVQSLKERRQKQVESLLQQARPAMKNGDFGKGIPILGKVLALDPSNSEARRLLKQVDQGRELESAYLSGVEAYRHENYREAAEDLGGVYEANPEYRDVAFLYRDSQSRVQPLESLPKDLSDLYTKGVEFYLKGQYAQAIVVWEKVLVKVPGNRLVARNLEEARTQIHESATPSPAKANP